jgi:hypothetical protein
MSGAEKLVHWEGMMLRRTILLHKAMKMIVERLPGASIEREDPGGRNAAV